MFQYTEKYYVREPGYVVGLNGISNRDISTGTPRISDNDGLWSHCYLGGLSYCYAVTKDKKVLEAARKCKSVKAFINVTTDKCYENLEKEGYFYENVSASKYSLC